MLPRAASNCLNQSLVQPEKIFFSKWLHNSKRSFTFVPTLKIQKMITEQKHPHEFAQQELLTAPVETLSAKL
ncbi:hypothetical protein C7N43_27245 [Sphingobacteriales bacterium UPWRP_1]|nr:hypothetical protein C7N43_27245 [Sphingobacteriales bacterium UPWRP_1]